MRSSVTASSEALLVGSAAQTEQSGSTTAVEALAVNTAISQYLAETGVTLTGAGLKIGILSDSFAVTQKGDLPNGGGGEASDIAAGLLPPDITIVEEGPRIGSADEGRAMAQEVYAIAPGAQIYFYSAFYSENDFAAGIETLAADGCNVIVDDVSEGDEPFYQDTGVITQAIETVISEGVNYFTAAGNDSNNFYEAAFAPMTFALPGIGTELTHDVANGSPYEAVSLSGGSLDMTLEWTQPFGDSQYDLGVGLYSYAGGSYTLVKKFTTQGVGGDPELEIQATLRNISPGTYYLAFYESSAAPGAPSPGIFKIISFEDSDATIDGTGAGTGSGTSIGHELAPGANTVAAVDVTETPAAGVAVPVVESFSSAGPGITYYNAGGTLLSTPVVDGNPEFAAVDGTTSDIFPGGFFGTSAAAPNAAAVALLMLQADARLAPAQITYLLERSAISTGDSITGGAGLIQADTAVAGAYAAATSPVWTAQDDSVLWTDGLNWSDSAVPTAASSVDITDGLGIFTGAYEIVFNETEASIASLDLDGGIYTGALPELTIQAFDTLNAGRLTLGAGTIFLSGTLDDEGALAAGSATGEIAIEGGVLELGGGAAGEKINFSGSGGDLWLGAENPGTLRGGLLMDITGFAPGDTIDFSGLAVSQVQTVQVTGSVASVLGHSSQVLAALNLTGDFSNLAFANDGGGGTEIYAACFAEGTRILNPAGAQVAVEDLAVGDQVALFSGGAAPVVWIGRRKILLRRHPRPEAVQPVLISAGAIGHGLPARDLVISPDHALYLRGRLIPAKALINGVSIRQLNRQSVTYYHIELPEHGVLLAEGAGAESYLETGNRGAFENGGPGMVLHPDFAQAMREKNGCAPFAESGPVVEAVRNTILRRAEIAMTNEPNSARR